MRTTSRWLPPDQNLDNGIQIDPTSHQNLGLAMDFGQDPAAFEIAIASTLDMLTSDLPGGPFALVSATDARDHVTLALYLTNAGLYRGIVSHDDTTQTEILFLVSREGAVYGSNESAAGLYAASGFDEETEWLSTSGNGETFKIDGSTGATHLVDVTMSGGLAKGEPGGGGDYPRFEATRGVSALPLSRLKPLLQNLRFPHQSVTAPGCYRACAKAGCRSG